PLSMLYCPTRRAPRAYPKTFNDTMVAHNAADNPAGDNVSGRTDYAINAGDPTKVEYGDGGPDASQLNLADPGAFGWPDTSECTGVSYGRSEVAMAAIKDG